MSDLHIENLNISDLKPWTKNARTHSKKQVKQLANSIEAFGFTNPVLIDDANNILAGHGRIEGAKQLGMTQVPCVRLSHMSPAQKQAYVLADNKLALNAGWDDELLAEELSSLMELDIDFDIQLTGFSISEVDFIIEGASPEEPGAPEDDLLPEAANIPQRVVPGDIWQLGDHRLICGNALEANCVESLMDGQLADMIFTDPPYNVRIDGNVCGKGAIKHKEFDLSLIHI